MNIEIVPNVEGLAIGMGVDILTGEAKAPGTGEQVLALMSKALAQEVAAVHALTDGRLVRGFLVEPIATEGAEDITSYGGWRQYREQ